jgi:hypothetical protein
MDFKLSRGLPGMPQLPPQFPTLLLVIGTLFAGFGLLLIWNEWLLRYLIAGVFLLMGALLLLAGVRTKRLLG